MKGLVFQVRHVPIDTPFKTKLTVTKFVEGKSKYRYGI